MAEKSLRDIIDEYKAKILEYKEQMINTQRETTNSVFTSADYEFVMAYERLINRLYNEVQSGRLSNNIENLIKLLEKDETKRHESAKATKTSPNYIPYQDAIRTLKEKDKETGKKTISNEGYRLRIRRAVEKGDLTAKRTKRRRIYSINADDLQNLTNQEPKSRKHKGAENSRYKEVVKLIQERGYTDRQSFDEVVSQLRIPKKTAQAYWMAIIRYKK